MELHDSESLEFFYNSVWKEPDPDESRNDKKNKSEIKIPRKRATILDTIIYREGKPYKWLFTSDKTGEVLKKSTSKMMVDEIIRNFTNRVRVMRGMKQYQVKNKIATVYYHSMNNEIDTRLVNETELRCVLDSSTNEDIIAIQVFVGGVANLGNGVYEHCVEKDENLTEFHETYELLNTDKDDKWGSMSNMYTKDVERLRVESVHHWNLVDTSREIIELLEIMSHTKISKVSFQFHFNTAWVAICGGIRGLILQDTPIELFAKKHHPFQDRTRPVFRNDDHKALDGSLQPHDATHAFAGGDKVTLTRVPSAPAAVTANGLPHHDVDRQELLQQALNNVTQNANTVHIPGSFADTGATGLREAAAVLPDHAGILSEAEKRMQHELKVAPLSATLNRSRRMAMQAGTAYLSGRQNYLLDTETSKQKLNYYRESVQGKTETISDKLMDIKKRRPISAPYPGKKGSKQKESAIGSGVRPGGHGLQQGGRRASSMEKPLTMAGDVCFGDFCQLIETLPENKRAKVKVADNFVYRAKNCENHIAYKSLLVPRAEAKFLGVAIDDGGADVKQLVMEHADADQIRAYFVKARLTSIYDKCRHDSYKIIFTSLKQDSHKLWDALQATYRKMVYGEALVGMHPSRFYYTVPVCESCYKVYAMMDRRRAHMLTHIPEKYDTNQEEKKTLKHKMSLREKWKKDGRSAIEKVIHVSQEYEHERWFRGDDDVEISDIQNDGNQTTTMLPDLVEGVEHHHNYSPSGHDKYGNTTGHRKQDNGKSNSGRRSDYDLDEDEVDERYRMSYESIEKRLNKKPYKVDVTSPDFKDRTEREVEVEERIRGVIVADDEHGRNNNDYDNELMDRGSYRQRFIKKMQSGIDHRPATTGRVKSGGGRHANYTKSHGHKVVQRELSEENSQRDGVSAYGSRRRRRGKDKENDMNVWRRTKNSQVTNTDDDNNKNGWRPPRIRKDKTGFGPKAPTFEGSYTRAMAKLQEDRVKRKEMRDKKRIEDKQRAKDEIFHITGQFGQIRNVYKDIRTNEEVNRREKQMAYHGKGTKKRPSSAGVLMPASFAFRAQLPNNDFDISHTTNDSDNNNGDVTVNEEQKSRNKKSSSDLAYTSLPFTPAPFLPIPDVPENNIFTTTNSGKSKYSSGKNTSKSGSNNSLKGASSHVMVIDDSHQYNIDRDRSEKFSDRDNDVAASIDSGIYPFSPGLAAMTTS